MGHPLVVLREIGVYTLRNQIHLQRPNLTFLQYTYTIETYNHRLLHLGLHNHHPKNLRKQSVLSEYQTFRYRHEPL